jgi:hypothetical protein
MGWRGIFNQWRKKESYRESAGKGFIPYINIFLPLQS